MTASAPTSIDAQKAVAALDQEYQEAVRNNDAATMGRILADDFVLVTGTGKTFSKSEARSKEMADERQEDSERKVRVWGTPP